MPSFRNSPIAFKLFGINIHIHFSWWFILIILTWSLAHSFFPQIAPNHSLFGYYALALASALLLFVSVLLHELAHSLIAKSRHIEVEHITLFFFGGVSSIQKEEMNPVTEFFMALAGPLFSFLLAGIFHVININTANVILGPITFYLARVNLMLAIFNLIPGYPLDGGRALRAILNAALKDFTKATHIASIMGKIVGSLLFLTGVITLLAAITNGVWLMLLGAFLYFVAGLSYETISTRNLLQNITLKNINLTLPPTINANQSFSEFTSKYAQTGQTLFLVKDKKPIGILNVEELPSLNSDVQQRITILELTKKFSQIAHFSQDASAQVAYQHFIQTNDQCIIITKEDEFKGVLTRQELENYLLWQAKFHPSIISQNQEKNLKRVSKKPRNVRNQKTN